MQHAVGRLQDRVCIVTGAAHGIGREVALAFIREGATVHGFDVDVASLEKHAALPETAGRLVPVRCDVSSVADLDRSVAGVAERAGCLHVLVNNAGINMARRIEELEPADWDRVMNSNLRSVYAACRAAWPFLRGRGGAIVNVASIMGQVGGVGAPAYCAAKAGLIMLSRCLAKDGAAHGIRVNCVSPGYIDTPIMDRVFQSHADPQLARAQLVSRMPMQRMGTTADVASGILFLASDEAAYVSGTDLTIDGAVTATQID